MENSSEGKKNQFNLFYMQIIRVGIFYLFIICISLNFTCLTPEISTKSPNLPVMKNNQQPSGSKLNKQDKMENSRDKQVVSSKKTAATGKTQSHTEEPGTNNTGLNNLDSIFGNLSKEETNILSWLIGGVLGLGFVMLIIKGIISKNR